MTEKKVDLKKTIGELKEKLSKQIASNKEPRKDMQARALRKQLKRAQRRDALQTKYTLEERQKQTQKRLDVIGKLVSDMTKGAKKTQGDPYVHSLRKKSKSLNKRLKKLGRLIEKDKKNHPAPAAAPATPPPAATT